MRGNATMLEMCKELGFTLVPDPNDQDIVLVKLALASSGER